MRKQNQQLTCFMVIDGEETEVTLPTKFEVCPRCEGKGTHVNPSIDGNGITSDQWAEWTDDERDDYFNGVYDVTCYTCRGANVVPVVDRKRATSAQLKAYDRQTRDMAEIDAIQRQEMLMESYAAGERW